MVGDRVKSAGGTVLFVCPHGAGKSRIAAAWFEALAPAGWSAMTAGVVPQASVSEHAPRLLRNTAALEFLDSQRPRPLSAVTEAGLVVAIDCPSDSLAADVVWSLEHREFDEGMAAELRTRVVEMVRRLEVAPFGRGGGADASG